MGFQQGLSGLNASAKSLEVIGNNIANSQTVGFKASRAEFADMYSSGLSGGGKLGTGMGVSIPVVSQSFTQGNTVASNNSMDLAISGRGFFQMEGTGGETTYTRNGQFKVSKDGSITNAQSQTLMGYGVDASGNLREGAPSPLKLSLENLKPSATKNSMLSVNLTSEVQGKEAVSAGAVTKIDPADSKSYNWMSSQLVYDSLGNEHTVNYYFRKIEPQAPTPATNTATASPDPNNPQNTWEVVPGIVKPDGSVSMAYKQVSDPIYTVGGTSTSNFSGAVVSFNSDGSIKTDANGKITGVKNGKMLKADDTKADTAADKWAPDGADTDLFRFDNRDPTTGADRPIEIKIDFTKMTQFSTGFNVAASTQDGYPSGRVTGFSVRDSGEIMATYSNRQTVLKGQVVLANFANPNGLQPVGDNQWQESLDSGQPLIGEPNSGSLGSLRSGAIEASNVDLTAEMVNMMTMQRAYQANAQTIRTEDQILQTIVQLR